MNEDVFLKQYWDAFLKRNIQIHCDSSDKIRNFLTLAQKEGIYVYCTRECEITDSLINTLSGYNEWYFIIYNSGFDWLWDAEEDISIYEWSNV